MLSRARRRLPILLAQTGMVVSGLVCPLPARANLPEAVAAMIRKAAEGGDAPTLAAVTKIAKATNPNDADAIDSLSHDAWTQAQAEALRRKQAELAARGLLQGWTGKVEAGAGLATGNSHETSATLGLSLRKEGLHLRHKVAASVDYLRSNGIVSKRKYAASYALNYLLRDGLYSYGTVGWEQDPFAGYAWRFTESAGLGARLLNRPDMTLDLDAGPALRQTLYTAAAVVQGQPRTESRIGGRASLDYAWTFASGAKFTQTARIITADHNSTIAATSALTSKLTGRLSARLSFDVQHETNPPDGLNPTDTVTHAGLVLDF